MARGTHRFSIFSQSLDRAVFVAYFLGAVVPLTALGWVVERFALPSLRQDVHSLALLALFSSIAALSLGSFLVVRRLTRQTLARMDGDNHRLAALVSVSGALAQASYGAEVARTVATCARRLTGASAAFVFLRREKGEPAATAEPAGEGAAALYERARARIDELVEVAIEGRRPALHGDGSSGGGEIAAAAAVPLGSGDACAGAIAVVRGDGSGAFDPREVDSLSTLAGLAAVSVRNADLQDAQKNFFAHVTDIILSALDTHLDYQVGHSRRVAHFANAMGRKLGFGDERLERLHFAALLHDIGMLKMDRARMESRAGVEKHSIVGGRMLERIRVWEDIAPFVQHHHEWWDGSGYPEGLAGDAIPVEARIIGIAEAFDSMTSCSYKPQVPVDEALERIERGGRTQFDPELANLFVALAREGVIRVEADRA